MKKVVLLFLMGLSKICLAQIDSTSIKFIRSVVQKSNVLYVDKLDKWAIGDIRGALNSDTLIDSSLGKTTHQIIVLNGNERIQIDNAIKKMSQMIWPNGVLEKSRAINKSEQEKLKIWKVTKRGRYFSFPQKYGGSIFSFSKPIFLRNNTMCIFYSGYLCGGLCGKWTLSIYMKIGATWEEASVLSFVQA